MATTKKDQSIANRLLEGVRTLLKVENTRSAEKEPTVSLNESLNPIDSETVVAYNKARSFGAKPLLCYAPSNSMVFGPFGNVSACCHSFKASGNYPEKSIKEIWSGGVFGELREHLKNDSLPSACAFCKTHLESGSFYGVASRTYDSFLPIKDGYPTIMEFFLDITCNLECIMCTGEYSSSIRKNREKLPPFQSIYGSPFVKELEQFIPYLQKASFVGGEPFLIDYYYQIWDRIFDLNPDCTIAITTNGTILNEKVKKVLEKGNFEIRLSLDGITKETYESIRLNANFDKVMENLIYLHAYCKRKGTIFEIVPCPQKNNWHEMPAIVEFANSLDSILYFSSAVRYPFHVCLWTLPSTELTKIHRQLAAYDFPSETNTEKHNLKIYTDFVGEVKMWIDAAVKRETDVSEATTKEFNNELKVDCYETITNHVNASNGLLADEKRKKIELVISKIEGLLEQAPTNFDQDEFFNFVKKLPMSKFVAWMEGATQGQVIDRFVNLLRSPYK